MGYNKRVEVLKVVLIKILIFSSTIACRVVYRYKVHIYQHFPTFWRNLLHTTSRQSKQHDAPFNKSVDDTLVHPHCLLQLLVRNGGSSTGDYTKTKFLLCRRGLPQGVPLPTNLSSGMPCHFDNPENICTYIQT
jgi:hypothetical protein